MSDVAGDAKRVVVVVPPPVEFRFLDGVDVVEVIVAGVLRRFVALLDFEDGVAFPAEKVGVGDVVDDEVDEAAAFAAAAPTETAAVAPPPLPFRESCHAFARAAASARASFLLFFGMVLASVPPPPMVGDVSAFRFGMMIGDGGWW